MFWQAADSCQRILAANTFAGLVARLCEAASITANLAWPFCWRTLRNPATPLPK